MIPTTEEIELAVANLFDFRRCLIVPNVHWGFNIHECDVLVVRPSGYLVEVEIKRSRADLLADFKKPHRSQKREENQLRIKELYYAVPDCMVEDALSCVPERHGIISVGWHPFRSIRMRKAKIIRCARAKKSARPITNKEYSTLARLGTIRIWKLKDKINKLNTNKV